MKPHVVLLLAAWLAAAVPSAALAEATPPGEAIALETAPVRLNDEAPEQTRIGRLRWRGGLALRAADARFGGLSALWLSDAGTRALAVSDEGHWVTFAPSYDAAGDLVGAGDARLGALHDAAGASLAGSKTRGDAEGLAALPDGTLLVSFERAHRLSRYAGRPPVGPPRDLPAPGAHEPGANAGIESITPLPGGGLLAISEGLTAEVAGTPAWQGFVAPDAADSQARPQAWRRFHLPRDGDLAPVAARVGPKGQWLYWLERGFSLIGGLRVKLKRAPLAPALAGELLAPEELAALTPPLTLDNLEGLWLRRGPAGETLITLLSDDNFNPVQRSLLLQFELLE